MQQEEAAPLGARGAGGGPSVPRGSAKQPTQQEGREPNRNRWLGAEPNANRCEPEPEWIFVNRNRHELELDLFFDPLLCFEATHSIFSKVINAKCLRRNL